MCKKHPKRYVEAIKEDINSGRIFQEPSPRDDMDDLYQIFNEPTYEDDINRLIQDLIKSKG